MGESEAMRHVAHCEISMTRAQIFARNVIEKKVLHKEGKADLMRSLAIGGSLICMELLFRPYLVSFYTHVWYFCSANHNYASCGTTEHSLASPSA